MRIRIGVILIAAAVLVLSLGSAALTNVTIDRTVSAGTVKADTDANVVVKFASQGLYGSLMSADADGVVSFNLAAALTNGATGFNPDAQFTIGSAVTPVFQITNNSNISITVTLVSSTGLALKDSTGAISSDIASGAAQTFYFEIDTTDMTAADSIGGTIQIRKTA